LQQFYRLKTRATILLLFLICSCTSIAQRIQGSLATDFTVVRSFKKEQRYWTIGQTVAGHFHVNPKDGLYVLFMYSGHGKFSNQLTATALDSTTVPQQINYTNKADLRFSLISIGWKRYLKGTFNASRQYNLYAYGGFGLMAGQVENTHSAAIDTASYFVPVLAGDARFKRLTIDLGLGFEVPVGGDVFFYMEGRTNIPTTDYPSKYLFVNNNAPLIASLNTGFRILFD
jgi:hypothetical protein